MDDNLRKNCELFESRRESSESRSRRWRSIESLGPTNKKKQEVMRQSQVTQSKTRFEEQSDVPTGTTRGRESLLLASLRNSISNNNTNVLRHDNKRRWAFCF